MNSNSLLFVFGAITFLVTFSWFKYAAMEVFKKELESAEEDQGVWTKLFKVFLVDWLVCVAGVLGTGILFVTVFNMAH
jgi:flagellar biosynthesis protein FlhB